MKLLWQQIPSTEVTKIYCNSNCDGIVLDTEHGVFNNETLFSLIQLINASGKKSFVRVTEPTKTFCRLLLDSGVSGLIFSTLDSLNDCADIKNWCKFPPEGLRGQGLVSENDWGDKPLQQNNVILVAQIENQIGIEKLPFIKGWDLFDYYLLGPYDLTADLGCVSDWKNENYILNITKFNELIPQDKRGVHLVSNIEEEYKTKFKGYGFVALGMDTTIIKTNINKLEQLWQD
jgi:2-dehydro-3-deoxyglucarate aldolase